MNFKKALPVFCCLALFLGLVSVASAAPTDEYIVAFDQTKGFPEDAAARVEQAGGVLVHKMPQLGIALAKSDDPEFLARLKQDGLVKSAGTDRKFQLRSMESMKSNQTLSLPKDIRKPNRRPKMVDDPTTAPFYEFQWNMHQIEVEDSWAAGHLSSPDVTVAVVESGVDYTHPELVGKVDLSLSISFVPEEDEIIAERYPGMMPFLDLNLGGTMTSAIIACNGVGTACIAPNATLIAVKTVDRLSIGSHYRHIQGILYSAMVDADIILATFGGNLETDDPNVEAIMTGYIRAVQFAEQMGSFVVSGIGGIARSEGINADRALLEEFFPPAQMTSALGVGGTSPFNQENFDERAFWLNYGNTVTDLVAPAGRIDADFFDQILGPCTAFSDNVPQCMILTEEDESDWTGFATVNFPAAHVAGTAALLKGHFGDLSPAQLRERILSHTDDLGEEGRDMYFGYGRLHAYNVFH